MQTAYYRLQLAHLSDLLNKSDISLCISGASIVLLGALAAVHVTAAESMTRESDKDGDVVYRAPSREFTERVAL